MPDRKKFLAAKRRLQKRIATMISDCEQSRRDIEWWNQNRLDAEPIDAGWEIVTAAKACKALALVEAGLPIPDELRLDMPPEDAQ